MAYQPRIQLVTRMRSNHSDDPPFRTLCFTTRGSGRSRSLVDFIDVDRVPDFEGEEAWFLMVKERVRDSPWPKWKTLKRVNPDGSAYEA